MKLIMIMAVMAGLYGAAGAAEFFDLQRLGATGVAGSEARGLEVPAANKWAVGYALDGILNIREGRIILNTPDGRLFRLELDPAQARRYDGRTVQVEGKAMQADDLDVLKVETIAPYTPPANPEQAVHDPMQRPAALVSDSDSELTVNNVRWLYTRKPRPGVFDWAAATVKPALIRDIYLIKQPFPPEQVAAHSLLLMTFEKGGLTDAAGNESYGLVLSVEAYLKQGQAYNPVTGMGNAFNIVWVLATWEDYSSRSVLLNHNLLIPYKLKNFSMQQKTWLAREAVRQAAVNRAGEFYNTVTNNCTNNLLILMNRALPEMRRIPMWEVPYSVYNVEATMPVLVPPYLQSKGLLGPELSVINAASLYMPLP